MSIRHQQRVRAQKIREACANYPDATRAEILKILNDPEITLQAVSSATYNLRKGRFTGTVKLANVGVDASKTASEKLVVAKPTIGPTDADYNRFINIWRRDIRSAFYKGRAALVEAGLPTQTLDTLETYFKLFLKQIQNMQRGTNGNTQSV